MDKVPEMSGTCHLNTEYRILKITPFAGVAGNLFDAMIVEYAGIPYSMVYETGGSRVLVSDEPYWNPQSAFGETFSTLVAVANYHGFQAGVCITPISLDMFGGVATASNLIDLAAVADFVAIDPYLGGWLNENQLLWFSQCAIDVVHGMGKKITVAIQGWAQPGFEHDVRIYNEKLAGMGFDEVVIFDALDFDDIPDEWQIDLIGIQTEMT